MNQEINQEIIEKYWQEVLHITRELKSGEQFSASEAIDYLNVRLPEGSKPVTKTKVNYLRTEGILDPFIAGEGKERINWRYTSNDVRRALLAELLKMRANLGVKSIRAWLKSIEETQKRRIDTLNSENLYHGTHPSPSSPPPTPVSSAYSLVRNRVLGTLIFALGFQIDSKIPADCLVAIRPMGSSPGTNLLYNSAWDQVRTQLEDGQWFLAASDSYSKLYIYHDLQQLQERRSEIARKFDRSEYKWYYMSLKDIHERYYEVILGLPLKLARQLAGVNLEYAIGYETDGKRLPIQLMNFPGLSTLLWIAFINQPEITGGTPLAALVEIIAEASTLWDYCTILVPEYDASRKAQSLRIQEYSSGFPPDLTDKRVDIGRFLAGWCYRYNQSIVVDPTIERDPRIAFFEEEGCPVAAAAIPATASGQHVAGAIYVASRTKRNEEEKVFSEELLACLEVLGYICGDMIARDQIEIETVGSAGRLSTQQLVHTFEDLRGLARGVVEEALRGVNPAEAIHSWIYLLTLNIQVTFRDTITEWLCTQGIEVTGEFLANHVFSPPAFPLSASPLPVGRCMVDSDKYAFAILRTVDLSEEEYKQKIVELESELNKLNIGSISPRLYPSAITFRYEILRKQLQENGVDDLVEDLVNRMDERLRAGLSLKRGHQYLYTAQPDQAASNFEDTLRYASTSWYALKHLAEARMLQGTEKAITIAIEKCEKALDLNPNYASAHCMLADCLSYQGEFHKAFVHYEKAIALESTNHSFLIRYGFALASMTAHEYREAIAYLKSKMPELFQRRQYLQEPWNEAIARFGQVRDLRLKGKNSNSSEAQEAYGDYYYLTGCTHLQAGNIDAAIEEFIMGRKHSPSNLNLAQVYVFALSLHRKEIERSMN